jgi:hypothetical protein
MEEAVYNCSWRQTSRGFTCWVTSRPEFRAEGATIGEAEEGLIEVIRNGGGGMVPVIEFNPPLPKSDLEAQYSEPELYLIGGDDRFASYGPRGCRLKLPRSVNSDLSRTTAFSDRRSAASAGTPLAREA